VVLRRALLALYCVIISKGRPRHMIENPPTKICAIREIRGVFVFPRGSGSHLHLHPRARGGYLVLRRALLALYCVIFLARVLR